MSSQGSGHDEIWSWGKESSELLEQKSGSNGKAKSPKKLESKASMDSDDGWGDTNGWDQDGWGESENWSNENWQATTPTKPVVRTGRNTKKGD